LSESDVVLEPSIFKNTRPKKYWRNEIMKRIRRVLVSLGATLLGVVFLASCNSKGSFETEYDGKTYSGSLYQYDYSYYSGFFLYYLVSDSNIYSLGSSPYEGVKKLTISKTYFIRIDANTWQNENKFLTLINDGQELMYANGTYGVTIYTKVDHIKYK
jgi:hypothetical protein